MRPLASLGCVARLARLALPALLAPLAACDFGTLDSLSQEVAQQGTDEVTLQARALWKFYEKGSDGTVKSAIEDVDGVTARVGELPIQVKIGPLTAEDLALVGKTNDPALAQGMLLINDLDCSLDQVTKLAVAKNQTDLYPGLYDAYTRTYVTGVQDFLAARSPTVVWKTNYTASAVSRTYDSVLTGGARFVPGANPHGGAVLLARTVLDAPANFTKGGDAEFNQDYQVELYYELAPNKVRHFYALWREFRISGLTAESDLYVNLVLGNLRDFDVRTSKICRDNSPAATFQ
jgi:hypothetical protein